MANGNKREEKRRYFLRPNERARNVTTILWAEDMEHYGENWYEKLVCYCASLHVPCCISPIHDQDTYDLVDCQKWRERHWDPDTNEVAEDWLAVEPHEGDPKKTHVHFAIAYDGSKSATQFSELMSGFVKVAPTKWEVIQNKDSLTRYFCHLDEHYTAKHVYDIMDFRALCGWDSSALLKSSLDRKIDTLLYVLDEIARCHFRHYNRLVDWSRQSRDYDIISCVTGRASFFAAYFHGLSSERGEEKERRKEAEKRARELVKMLELDAEKAEEVQRYMLERNI